MAKNEKSTGIGAWLFRWRNYLPWLTLPLFLLVLRNYAPLNSRSLDLWWELLCLSVSFSGLAVRIATTGFTPRGTSGRRMQNQKAEQLNITGLYFFVRHPLYLGNFLVWLGICLFLHSFLFALACIVIFFLFYLPIINTEETFLRDKFGETFENWAQKTPMIIPGLNKWKKPPLPFSVRTVLKREYSTFCFITSVFFLLEVIGDYFYTGKIKFDMMWVVIFMIGLVVYLVFMIARSSNLLKVEGR